MRSDMAAVWHLRPRHPTGSSQRISRRTSSTSRPRSSRKSSDLGGLRQRQQPQQLQVLRSPGRRRQQLRQRAQQLRQRAQQLRQRAQQLRQRVQQLRPSQGSSSSSAQQTT
jgi:uncharacterized coiled-coil DUF342 family protein